MSRFEEFSKFWEKSNFKILGEFWKFTKFWRSSTFHAKTNKVQVGMKWPSMGHNWGLRPKKQNSDDEIYL